MADRICAGCATELPPPKPREGKGNQRKWCSGSCRVWAHSHPGQVRKLSTQCEYCAGPISDPRVDKIFCSALCGIRQRANVPIPTSTSCPECAADFTPISKRQRYCTKTCAGRACNRRYLAAHPEKSGEYRAAAKAAGSRSASCARRRTLKVTTAVESFAPGEIYERDGWRCGLCRRKVDPALTHPHPRSASLDHILPLSLGGEHVRANVQLAHLTCNVQKGARSVGEQLLLVG